MSIQLVRSSTNCIDVRWTSSGTGWRASFYVVNVAVPPSDDADAGQEWTIVISDSKKTALRLNLEHSGLIVTVKGCITGWKFGVEHWTVIEVGKSSSEASADASTESGDGDPLEVQLTPTTPSGDNDYNFF